MVTDTRDVFKLWDTSLRKLYAIRQGLMSGSGNVCLDQAVGERQYWNRRRPGGMRNVGIDLIKVLSLPQSLRPHVLNQLSLSRCHRNTSLANGPLPLDYIMSTMDANNSAFASYMEPLQWRRSPYLL